MARKASDLLDVFRLRPESSGGDSSPKRKASGRGSKASKQPKRKKTTRTSRPSEVVLSLTRRQMMYAGCVGVLLMALSFTLGVTLGGGNGDDDGPALRRDAPIEWYILGELPMRSEPAAREVDVQRAAVKLRHELGVAVDKLKLSKTQTHYRLWIGPFESRDDAFRYHETYQLDTYRYLGLAPFNPGSITKTKPPARRQ
ncbi:MAG: hypothetical protein QNJ98_15465 [Planctomycetota bacterium]|nr:hypothetical protein [Planctomycetota bacterium]